ncbi:MAG: arylesterase [Acidobacteria bacterium]|nr:arylesterase [Acidobacteriota bacterium]
MNRNFTAVFLIATLIALSACGRTREKREKTGEEHAPSSSGNREAVDMRPVLVAFGDSLTAGAGVDPEDAYPAKLQERIDRAGYSYHVVNAGVSGETSSQGLNRLPAIVGLRPSIVIVEFGANDGLRGVPVEAIRHNLDAIVAGLQTQGIKVILAGMELPPNYGRKYTETFREIFRTVAEERGVPLIPFLLEGVGGHARLNQDDGIHPTAEGHDIVAENVWKILRPLLSLN